MRLAPLQFLRELELEEPLQEDRPSFVSAASGLVLWRGSWFVCSDDENAIVEFRDGQPGFPHFLFSDVLPVDGRERKKVKPDLEALTLLDDALFAVPSGSRKERCQGAVFGAFPRPVDFFPLYDVLEDPLGDLNIEGAVCAGPLFWLFNRGNSMLGGNAIVMLDPLIARREIESGELASFERIVKIDLGEIDGVPLGFTDACPDGRGGALFLAAAEATSNPYDDGGYHGATLGAISGDGALSWLERIDCARKPEGLWLAEDGELRLVTDADDSSIPGEMLSTKLSR